MRFFGKSKKPQLLSELLPEVLDELKISDKIVEQKAILLWRRAVGNEIKKHTKPYSIENGVLVVLVDNSAWMNELTFLKTEIIKKLNNFISSVKLDSTKSTDKNKKEQQVDEVKQVVKDIRFRLMSRP
jgi:predicted nucleic acid-binding Zn ribbon protein